MALPFYSDALRNAVFHETQRIIRKTDPPKPSTRLGSLGDFAAETASR